MWRTLSMLLCVGASRELCRRVSPWCIVLLLALPVFALPVHAQQIHFRDVTSQAGLRFTHNNGACGKKWLPETMGPGCAFIDYDNDGYPDILLVNGEDEPGQPHAGTTGATPHRNAGRRTRSDVTK